MTNLVQVAEEITYVPTDQLAGMIDNPNSRFPSFIVLSEIQRRNLQKRSYDAEVAAQNKPDTTVAQEAVAELTGLAGVPSNQPLSSPMGESPVGGGVPAPSGLGGMQMMAGGGRTEYSSGRRTQLASERLAKYLQLDPLRLPEEARGVDLLALQAQMQGIDPNKYRSAYNEIMATPLDGPASYNQQIGGAYIDYESMREEQARKAQEDAIEKARMKMLTDAGLGGMVQERLSELGPDSVPTYIPIGMENEIKSAGDYASSQLMTAGLQSAVDDGKSTTNLDGITGVITNKEKEDDGARLKKAADEVRQIFGEKRPIDIGQIKTDVSGLEGLRDLIPEFDPEQYRVDFAGLSDAEKKTKQDVTFLSGLSKAVGSATNLAEFGTGVADLAQRIEAQKDKFRAEDLELNKARVANEMAIAELAKGNRDERAKIEGTLASVSQADSVANINNELKKLEMSLDRDKTEANTIIEYIKNIAYRRYISTLEVGRLNTEEKLVRDTLDQLNDALADAQGQPELQDRLRQEIKNNQMLLDQITLRRGGGEAMGNAIVTDLSDL